MGSKQHVLTEIKRVVQVERRVIGRKVERGEVVPLGFGFRTESDGEAQLAEDVFDLFDDEGDGMLRAKPLAPRRHRQIDLALRRAGGLELATTVVEVGLELRFDGVDQGAGFTKLAWGKRWQLLEEIRQSPGFSSEERRARLFEQCGRRRRVDQLLAVSGERGD